MRRGRKFILEQIKKRKRLITTIAVVAFAIVMALPFASWAIELQQDGEAPVAEEIAAVPEAPTGNAEEVPEKVEKSAAANTAPVNAEVATSFEESDEAILSMIDTSEAANELAPKLTAPPSPGTDSSAEWTASPTILQPGENLPFPDDQDPSPTVVLPAGTPGPGLEGPEPTVTIPGTTSAPGLDDQGPVIIIPGTTSAPDADGPSPTISFPDPTAAPTFQVPGGTITFPTPTPVPTFVVPSPTVLVPGTDTEPLPERPTPEPPYPSDVTINDQQPAKTQVPVLRGEKNNPTPSASKNTKAPKTDDTAGLPFWTWTLLGASCLVLVMTIKLHAKKASRER